MTGIFGPSIDSEDVENAVIAHLQAWMPTYIAEQVRVKDPEGKRWPNSVEEIRQYAVSHSDAVANKWPEDQIPMIVVQSPGEAEDPRVAGDNTVISSYNVTLMAVAEGMDEEDSKGLARLYASAARQAMIQHPDLSAGTATGFANAVGMGPEGTDVINRGVEASRSLAGTARLYVVEVHDVLLADGGPLKPQTAKELAEGDEPPAWPTVKEDGGSVTVSKKAALEAGGFFE